MKSRWIRAAAKIAYIATILAFASIGTVNWLVTLVEDARLAGVERDAKRPSLSLKAAFDETFQRDFVAWFEQSWGLRGYSVRTDNSIVAALFAETRTGDPVIARDGVLINGEDIAFINRPDDPAPMIAYAKNVARVQAKMRRRGKVVVPVIIPSKTSFFQDAIPPDWQRRGAFGRANTNVYGAFVGALKAANAKFVDGRALLSTDVAPDHVFAPTGRHWRLSAGCRVLQAALDVARPDLPEIGNDQFACTTRVNPNASVDDEDFDLFRLLNTWSGKPQGMNVEELVAPKGPDSMRVPTLFVGSSFVWKFVRVARALEILQPSLFYYYDASVVDTETLRIINKVEPFTDRWRLDTFGKRLFIVGILETYLPADGERFFSELEKEIDSIDSSRSSDRTAPSRE